MFTCCLGNKTRMCTICQIPRSVLLYIKSYKSLQFLLFVLGLTFYCEFLHFYIVLLYCRWPSLSIQYEDVSVPKSSNAPIKVMILADTHLLGSRKGHWFDKLRREWQMYRAFQSSMAIHSPDAVFLLGDVLDEGMWQSKREFKQDVDRFRKMFTTPLTIPMHVLVGNHDVGFHYMMSIEKHKRFEEAFDMPSVKMLTIKNNIFVLVNSMAMEGDGCNICSEAVSSLKDLSWQLKCSEAASKQKKLAPVCDTLETFAYTKPILLQHFPMYRPSDANCSVPDSAPESEKNIPFRQKLDCISKEATDQLFDWTNPRLVISGHTHNGCYHVHKNGVPEWTVSSFNWRNKKNPTFLLAVISNNNYSISQCYLPNEYTVISVYIFGAVFLLLSLLYSRVYIFRSRGQLSKTH